MLCVILPLRVVLLNLLVSVVNLPTFSVVKVIVRQGDFPKEYKKLQDKLEKMSFCVDAVVRSAYTDEEYWAINYLDKITPVDELARKLPSIPTDIRPTAHPATGFILYISRSPNSAHEKLIEFAKSHKAFREK